MYTMGHRYFKHTNAKKTKHNFGAKSVLVLEIDQQTFSREH